MAASVSASSPTSALRCWNRFGELCAHGGVIACHADQSRGELTRLLGQQINAATGDQRNHLEVVGVGAHNVERLAANRAGAAQHGDPAARWMWHLWSIL